MIMSEYAQKFLELSRYSPESMMYEGKKVRKFEWGLRLEIRQQLYVFELNTYSTVLANAQLIERNLCIFPQALGNSRLLIPHRKPAPTASI